jgi:hypothetical protein
VLLFQSTISVHGVKMSNQAKLQEVIDNQAYINLLDQAEPDQAKQLIRTASSEQAHIVCEIIFNAITGVIPLTPKQLAGLKKHKKVLHRLAKKSLSTKKRKENLEQLGNGLPLIIPAAVSFLASFIPSLFNR